jgi:hypothetical protein
VNPWSLLPNLGLSVRGAVQAQVIWFAYAVIFLLIRPTHWVEISLAWAGGAWMVFYITQRLGGREAMLLGVAPRITPDSPFQMRLMSDILYVLALVFIAAIIAFGAEAIRGLVKPT